MANTELKTVIVLRNDNSLNWEQSSYKLSKGEVGIEILDSGKVKMKVGTDGTKTWSELPYFGGEEAQVFQVGSLAELEAKTALVGDIGIVTESANGHNYQTAYVYNGSAWAAMDGNYSAENVFLADNLTLAGEFESVGNYDKGETIAAGTSLQDVLSGMFQKELNPEVTYPSLTINASGGSGEVGSEYTVPTAILTVNSVGSYSYDPVDTGVVFESGNVKLAEGADPSKATNYKTNTDVMGLNSTLKLMASGESKRLYTDTVQSYTFSAIAMHTNGVMPKTNLGNDCPDAQILSDSVEPDDKTVSFSGWRQIFAGGSTAAALTSADIRALAKVKKSNETVPTTSGGKGIKFNAVKGSTKVVFAYPSTWTTKTPNFEIFTMAWGATSGFEKTTIQVADARGGENGLTEYNVYIYTPATPLAADNTEYCVYFK